MNHLRKHNLRHSSETGSSPVFAVGKARGNALTEFAFMMPILLMGMFGVIDFGRALYSYHFVSDAAREATRWASVRGKDCIPPQTSCNPQEEDIQEYVASIAPPGINTSSQTLDVDASWFVKPGSSVPCPDEHSGCVVQVHITYSFTFIFPFLPNSTYPMQSTSQMVISQ